MNMGIIDRIIRVILGAALVLIGVYLTSGAVTIILCIIGGILLVTALVGFCPLYALFHISTKSKR